MKPQRHGDTEEKTKETTEARRHRRKNKGNHRDTETQRKK